MARTTPSTAQARADHKVVLVATVTDMQCVIEWGCTGVNCKGQHLDLMITKNVKDLRVCTLEVRFLPSISLRTGGIKSGISQFRNSEIQIPHLNGRSAQVTYCITVNSRTL